MQGYGAITHEGTSPMSADAALSAGAGRGTPGQDNRTIAVLTCREAGKEIERQRELRRRLDLR